jgi:hypothetical protein
MWRLVFCVVALLAAPALAQTLRYDDDDMSQSHRAAGHRRIGKNGGGKHAWGSDAHGGHERGPRHQRRHPKGLSARAIDPARFGPAPAGFWYRCDAPAGYYPYILSCRTAWRFVPSVPPR